MVEKRRNKIDCLSPDIAAEVALFVSTPIASRYCPFIRFDERPVIFVVLREGQQVITFVIVHARCAIVNFRAPFLTLSCITSSIMKAG